MDYSEEKNTIIFNDINILKDICKTMRCFTDNITISLNNGNVGHIPSLNRK